MSFIYPGDSHLNSPFNLSLVRRRPKAASRRRHPWQTCRFEVTSSNQRLLLSLDTKVWFHWRHCWLAVRDADPGDWCCWAINNSQFSLFEFPRLVVSSHSIHSHTIHIYILLLCSSFSRKLLATTTHYGHPLCHTAQRRRQRLRRRRRFSG